MNSISAGNWYVYGCCLESTKYKYYFYYCKLERYTIEIFHWPVYQIHCNKVSRFSTPGLNNAAGVTIDPGYYSDSGSFGNHDGA
jgi:hypothetical protein